MSTLSKRYAYAIFELMTEETDKAKESMVEEFLEIGSLYKENKELKKILSDPTLSLKLKKEVLAEIMKIGNFKSLTVKSLNFILESGRFEYITEISLELSKIVNEFLNKVKVIIITAREFKKGIISDPLSKVKKEIENNLKGKKVIYEMKVDPSIIGGIIVKIGDKLYDFSVKNSLESIKMAIS